MKISYDLARGLTLFSSKYVENNNNDLISGLLQNVS
jgi:hypothetical protein